MSRVLGGSPRCPALASHPSWSGTPWVCSKLAQVRLEMHCSWGFLRREGQLGRGGVHRALCPGLQASSHPSPSWGSGLADCPLKVTQRRASLCLPRALSWQKWRHHILARPRLSIYEGFLTNRQAGHAWVTAFIPHLACLHRTSTISTD